MQAMVLTRVGLGHVEPIEIEIPVPGPDEVLVKVLACGVCRTDLHVVDGELPEPTIPVVPGHEIHHDVCRSRRCRRRGTVAQGRLDYRDRELAGRRTLDGGWQLPEHSISRKRACGTGPPGRGGGTGATRDRDVRGIRHRRSAPAGSLRVRRIFGSTIPPLCLPHICRVIRDWFFAVARHGGSLVERRVGDAAPRRGSGSCRLRKWRSRRLAADGDRSGRRLIREGHRGRARQPKTPRGLREIPDRSGNPRRNAQ